jgi:hypothetical protein
MKDDSLPISARPMKNRTRKKPMQERDFKTYRLNQPPQELPLIEKLAWEYHLMCEMYDESIGMVATASCCGQKMTLSNHHSVIVKRYLVQKFLIDPDCRHLLDDEVGLALRAAICRMAKPFADRWLKRDKS